MKKIIIGALLLTMFASGAAQAAQDPTILESRSYLYAGSAAIYTHNVDRTKGNLNLVCPDYFELTDTGGLKLTRAIDDSFVIDMHERKVEVLPFLSNHWDRAKARKALANADALTRELVAQVQLHNLDGLDIDIENINHEDRAAFTAFIQLLRQRLPVTAKLSVCVAANPWGGTTGWQGAYDYKALGAICDAIFIMTYDESYEGGTAGPVASKKFIRDSLAYAIKHVPSHKIMMGVPFYGRYWIEGNASGGKAFILSDIKHMVDNYKSVQWFDATNQTARAQVTVTSADIAAGLWGNRKLTAGVYDIWYESPESLQDKLGLVRDLGLGGAGSWALGFESAEIWQDYRMWLYGLPFVDIQNHWAQHYIVGLHDRRIVAGYEDHFHPENSVSRAEMATMLCRLLNLSVDSASSGFNDTRGHWADGYIASLRKLGLLQGKTATTFDPDAPMTRQETAVLFDRVLQVPQTIDFNEQKFPDVSNETHPWSNNAILTLAICDVLEGDEKGYFHPEGLCTRAQAAKIVQQISTLPLKIPTGHEPIIEPR